MKTLSISTNYSHRSLSRSALLVVPLLLACFALSPQARAVCQEGCLPSQSTALGEDALLNSTGLWNTAIGFAALFSNTTGPQNTANGFEALFSNTSGSSNTAMGAQALYSNTTGSSNTATGLFALFNNTTGNFNVAVGVSALSFNTTGSFNTSTGDAALVYNTSGSYNTATGTAALNLNSTGADNTAIGYSALHDNTTGFHNTATGFEALFSNRPGYDNTATGHNALHDNRSGVQNTASGAFALGSNRTGNNNIAIGSNAGFNLTTGSNDIDIGNVGVAAEANTIRIGTQGTQTGTFIAGISGVTVAGGVAVVIDASGQLGTTTSSARFKDEIQPMDKASEAILALKPVTFCYKHEIDPEGVREFGLVAEDVEKVNPDLVARDADGKAYTVRYEAVNAMLLNEFLKEHRKNEKQQATIAELKSTVAQQQEGFEAKLAKQEEEIEALTAGLQKVSAQLELSRSAPQTALNNQ